MEAWLALRGIRTFAIRVQRGSESALELAKRLSEHPKVSRVRYPGLPTDPQHERAKSFMRGFGAVFSFEVKASGEETERVCNAAKLITNATSLGGVETLWERRRRWPIESEVVPESLIRVSVGIENVEDLWDDIKQALDTI
jgi:cystathionine gamma-synthase